MPSEYLAPVTLTISGAFLVGGSIANLVVYHDLEKNNVVRNSSDSGGATSPSKQTIANMYWLNVFILFIGLIMLMIGIYTWLKVTRAGRRFIRASRDYTGDVLYYGAQQAYSSDE